MHRNEVIRFVVFAYVIGFVFQTIFFFHPDQNIWLMISMWAPTLAVVLSGPNARSSAWNALKGFDLKLFPLAFIIGATPYITLQLLIGLFGLGTIDSTVKIGHILLVLLLEPFAIGILLALGEEIGWRGFLQPELEKRFKSTIVYLVVGVIWAYWHLPANLGGHNGLDHRTLHSFLIFPMMVIAMSFVFGWLRSSSKTIWPCVYLHGVINSVSNCWLIKPNTELLEKLSVLSAWLILGIIFYYRIQKRGNRMSSAVIR